MIEGRRSAVIKAASKGAWVNVLMLVRVPFNKAETATLPSALIYCKAILFYKKLFQAAELNDRKLVLTASSGGSM
jgi:hypothetical protein